jgi:arabinofuranan 3-O-arabinosyltransferase
VGFWEIGVPGVKVTQIARLPERFRELVTGLDNGARERLAATPLDVVLTRQAGDPAQQDDDEERALERSFWLPDQRSFQASGLAAAAADLPEPAVDQLVGNPAGIVARSSSRAFDLLSLRASAAIDGVPDTAWVPGHGVGDWIELAFPPERIDHVTVTQEVPKGLKGVDVVTEAKLSVDGRSPLTVHLKQGRVRIDLPRPINASKLRLTLAKTTGLGTQVRISEIGVGNVHVKPAVGGAPLRACVELAQVDGRPLLAALQGTLQQLEQGASLPFSPCRGQRLLLGPGEHRLSSSAGWLVNLVDLSAGGTAAASTAQPSVAPRFTITSSTPTRLTLDSEPSQGSAWYLVLGQGFDSRWRATVDGQPLGPPVAMDGWSAGWRISDPRAHHIAVEFVPQRAATLSLVASLAALLLVAGLLVGGWRQRRARARRTGEDQAAARGPVQW